MINQQNTISRGTYPILFVGCFLCTAFALLATSPLVFFDRLVIGDDLKAHYRWVSQFSVALSEGYLYPRWMPREHLGIGEPAFLYYPPLYAYLVSFVKLFVGDIWAAIKVVAFLSNGLAGFATLWALRKLLPLVWCVGAAACVQLSPMVFHTLFYHNFLPFHVALPLHVIILYMTYTLVQQRRVGVLLALSMASLCLLHIVSAVMILLVLSVLICLYAVRCNHRGTAWTLLRSWGLSVLIGLGLAAVYLVPALTTLHLVIPNQWYEPPYIDWRNSFSLPTISAYLFGMRWFSVQWVIGLSLLVPSMLATLYFMRFRSDAYPAGCRAVSSYLLVFSWVAWFFGTEFSWVLWRHVEFVQKIQFPYRFLFLLSASAIPALFLAMPDMRGRAWRVWLWPLLAAAALLALTAVYAVKVMDEGVSPAFDPVTLDSPHGAPPMAYFVTRDRGPEWHRYMEEGGLVAEAERKGMQVETVAGQSQDRTWLIEADRPELLVLPLYAFPAWTVTVNDRVIETDIDSATGLIVVPVATGSHTIRVAWTGLLQERIGLWITLLTSILVGAMLVLRK